MLTFSDEKRIREIVREEIRFLPTKDEFYTMMDKLFGELKAIREELAFHKVQIDRNT